MTDLFPPAKQRPALLAFAESLDSRASALRRDECGDWAIWGTNGHIYAVPEGFQLMIGCDFGNVRWTSARGWESAKKRLGFGEGDAGRRLRGLDYPRSASVEARGGGNPGYSRHSEAG
jgi:hypothetical protein